MADASSLLPGRILKFEGVAPVYGRITELHGLPETGTTETGCLVRIRLLHGQPGMGAQNVTILDDEAMAAEVQDLLPAFRQPLQLGAAFRSERACLGLLTLVDGHDFVLKYRALEILLAGVSSELSVLIVDPLGVFMPDAQTRVYKAGEAVRLSIREVGATRFLAAFGEFFPDSLRQTAMAAIAEQLPHMPEFVGFSRLMNLESAADMPLKNLILQNYYATAQARVFADQPEQVFEPGHFATPGVNVVDLSALPGPWQRLFYESLCAALLRGEHEIVPVLIYPERFLDLAETILPRAEEAGLHLIVLASSELPEALRRRADNTLTAEASGRISLEGELTAGLPVTLTSAEAGPALPVSPESAAADDALAVPVARAALEFSAESVGERSDVAEAPAAFFNVDPPPGETVALAAPPERPAIVDLSAPEPEPYPPVISPAAAPGMSPPSEAEPRLAADEPVVSDTSSARPSELAPGLPADIPVSGPWVGGVIHEWPGVGDETAAEKAGQPETPENELTGMNAYAGGVDYTGAVPEDWEEAPSLEALYATMPQVPEIVPEAASTEPVPYAAMMPEPPVFPEATGEDFDFDVNLDLKPEEEWAFPQAEAPAVSSAISQSMREFDQPAAAPAWVGENATSGLQAPQPEAAGRLATPDAQTAAMSEADGSGTAGAPENAETGQWLETESADREFAFESSEATQASTVGSGAMPGDMLPPIVEKKPELSVGGYQSGDRVRHETYGLGLVNKVIPMEEGNVVLNVTFESVGKRLLDPALCKLTREG